MVNLILLSHFNIIISNWWSLLVGDMGRLLKAHWVFSHNGKFLAICVCGYIGSFKISHSCPYNSCITNRIKTKAFLFNWIKVSIWIWAMTSNLWHGQIVSGVYSGGGINIQGLDHIRNLTFEHICGDSNGNARLTNLAGAFRLLDWFGSQPFMSVQIFGAI